MPLARLLGDVVLQQVLLAHVRAARGGPGLVGPGLYRGGHVGQELAEGHILWRAGVEDRRVDVVRIDERLRLLCRRGGAGRDEAEEEGAELVHDESRRGLEAFLPRGPSLAPLDALFSKVAPHIPRISRKLRMKAGLDWPHERGWR